MQFTWWERSILAGQRQILKGLGCIFLTLPDIDAMCQSLHDTLCPRFIPDSVVGISTGGNYAAHRLAQLFHVPHHVIQITRSKARIHNLELNDLIGLWRLFPEKRPSLLQPFPDNLEGQRVLLVDDDYRSQKSLTLAETCLLTAGAAEIQKAVLVEPHSGANPAIYGARRQFPINRFIQGTLRFPWNQHSPHYPSYREWAESRLETRDALIHPSRS